MKIEIRADCIIVEGYVNAVGRDSRVLPSAKGKFIEQVEPKTFERAISNNDDVILKHNHKRVIGSTKDNLALHEDNIGLYATATVTDEDVRAKAVAGELRGWSFGFEKRADIWEDTSKGIPRRTLTEIKLNEVSIIDSSMTPCYTGTSIEVRGEEDIICEVRSFEDGIEIIDNSENRADGKEPIDYSNTEKEIEILKLRQPKN